MPKRRRREEPVLPSLPVSGRARSLLFGVGVRTIWDVRLELLTALDSSPNTGQRTIREAASFIEFFCEGLTKLAPSDPIDCLPLAAKALSAVKETGVHEVAGFLAMTSQDVAELWGCGVESLRQIAAMQRILRRSMAGTRGAKARVLATSSSRKPLFSGVRVVRGCHAEPVWPGNSVLTRTLSSLVDCGEAERDFLWDCLAAEGAVLDILADSPPELSSDRVLLMGDHAESLSGLSVGCLLRHLPSASLFDPVFSAFARYATALLGDMATISLASRGRQIAFMLISEVRGFEDWRYPVLAFPEDIQCGIARAGINRLGVLAERCERDVLGVSDGLYVGIQALACVYEAVSRLRVLLPRMRGAAAEVSQARSLVALVTELAKDHLDARMAMAYLLRSGLYTGQRHTLEETAGVIKRSRERARQLHMQAADHLKALSTMQVVEVLSMQIRQCVESCGGVTTLRRLGEHLAESFGWDCRPPDWAVAEVVSLWTQFPVEGATVHDPALPCLSCDRLAPLVGAWLDSHPFLCWADLIGTVFPSCVSRCHKRSSIALDEVTQLAAKCIVSSQLEGVPGVAIDADGVSDASHWSSNRTPISVAAEEVVRESGKALTAKEVHAVLVAARRDSSKAPPALRRVYSSLLESGKLLLWGRGKFLHEESIQVPGALTQEIHDWVEDTLNREGLPFMSGSRPLSRFRLACRSHGIPTREALCSLVKRAPRLRLRVHRKRYFYPPGDDRVPFSVAVESYIESAGEAISKKQLRRFVLRGIGLSESTLNGNVLPNLTNIVRDSCHGLVHVSNLPLQADSLSVIANQLLEFAAEHGHASVVRSFEENVVSCHSMGLTDPMMLFTALRETVEDGLDFGHFPNVGVTDAMAGARLTLAKAVEGFVKDCPPPGYCTLEQLSEHFVDLHRYAPRSLWNVLQGHERILRYLRGCVIHRSRLGWDAIGEQQFEETAVAQLDEACRRGQPYVTLEQLAESLLPSLGDRLAWTLPLVQSVLRCCQNVVVLDSPASVYIASGRDAPDVRDLASLLEWVVRSVFSGGVDLAELNQWLLEQHVCDRRVGKGMVQGTELLALVGTEVVLKRLVENRA
jgi:hypothetical protein